VNAPAGPPAEPVTPIAPRPVGWPLLSQWWRELTFLHWPVPTERIAPLLPAGTRPDELDGSSYVGLVAFRMSRVGPGPGPGVPYFGTFAGTNVRLYTVDGAGRRGVLFRSLDAARLAPVLVARWGLGLPYLWSKMTLTWSGDEIHYTCRRRWPGPRGARSDLRVRVGEPIDEPSALEHFVTARWGLHWSGRGTTRYLPNIHPRWPLRRAELLHLDDALVAAAGIEVTGPPVSVLYSPGVPVRFGRPR
jgi:uncharacterized protein